MILRHEFADGGLQSKIKEVYIRTELQDQHPGAVLHGAHVVHQEVRQHQGNKHAQKDSGEIRGGPLQDPAFVETGHEANSIHLIRGGM